MATPARKKKSRQGKPDGSTETGRESPTSRRRRVILRSSRLSVGYRNSVCPSRRPPATRSSRAPPVPLVQSGRRCNEPVRSAQRNSTPRSTGSSSVPVTAAIRFFQTPAPRPRHDCSCETVNWTRRRRLSVLQIRRDQVRGSARGMLRRTGTDLPAASSLKGGEYHAVRHSVSTQHQAGPSGPA